MKQKLKTVQDDLKPSNEPPKMYTQYFSPTDTYSKIGYVRSCDDYFRKARSSRIEYLIPITRQTLLFVELLTTINERIPPNGNSKERLSRLISIHLYILLLLLDRIRTKSRSMDGRFHLIEMYIMW